MPEMPEQWFVHKVTVEPYLGHNAYGEKYGPAFELPCFLTHRRHLVGTGEGGEQIVSTATLRASRSFSVPNESLVTLPDGSRATVLLVADEDDGSFGAWQHLKVELG